MRDHPIRSNCPLLERFSDRGRQVVELASREATALGHDYVGSEHLLLGVAEAEREGVAETEGEAFLGSIGVTPERIRALVVRIFGSAQPATREPRALAFTPYAKSALEWALRSSTILGQKMIDSEHILMGLAIERDGGAARVLRECDVSPDEVRGRLLRELATRRTGWTDS